MAAKAHKMEVKLNVLMSGMQREYLKVYTKHIFLSLNRLHHKYEPRSERNASQNL